MSKRAFPRFVVSLAASLLVLAVLLLLMNKRAQSDLPPGDDPLQAAFWPAPDFLLSDQASQPTTLEDLRGRVWVADFFFTSCPGICPILAEKMRWLSDEIADHPERSAMRLVSFSLDPQRDTVEVLSDYAEAVGATPDRWLFLTGTDRRDTWELSNEGFKLAVADTPQDPVNPISHTGKMVLVDRRGDIRGYYDGLTAAGVKDLKRDLLRLVEQDL